MVRMGHPRVVGETLACILLGPTLLGKRSSHVIFPLEVRPKLGAIAMLTLTLFVFLAASTLVREDGRR
jgi:Kef-type K+ transport system membrane component KefB